jgi:hypothetical protein
VDRGFLKERGVPSVVTWKKRRHTDANGTPDGEARQGFRFELDEIARQGASRMLIEALEAEVEEYLESSRSERDERGRALVVRN